MGKREFSQLSPLELVTLLLIPELVSQAALGEDFSMTNSVIALATLFSLVFLSSLGQFHSSKVAKAVNGTPTVLVHNGVMYADNMELERVSEDEILGEMHKSGIAQLEELEWVILETDGRISVISTTHQSAKPPAEEVL